MLQAEMIPLSRLLNGRLGRLWRQVCTDYCSSAVHVREWTGKLYFQKVKTCNTGPNNILYFIFQTFIETQTFNMSVVWEVSRSWYAESESVIDFIFIKYVRCASKWPDLGDDAIRRTSKQELFVTIYYHPYMIWNNGVLFESGHQR